MNLRLSFALVLAMVGCSTATNDKRVEGKTPDTAGADLAEACPTTATTALSLDTPMCAKKPTPTPTPKPDPCAGVGPQLQTIFNDLINRGKINPLPPECGTSDPARWIWNCYDTNDSSGPGVTSKCAWIVQTMINDPRLAQIPLPAGCSLQWLEFDTPLGLFNHSVIGVVCSGQTQCVFDPWRGNFNPDKSWNSWTPTPTALKASAASGLVDAAATMCTFTTVPLPK